VEPSFIICENLMFGRRSFKGFNPEIEVMCDFVYFNIFDINVVYFCYKSVADMKTLEVFYLKCLRQMLMARWHPHITVN